jgi:hypothetical protein
MFFEVTIRNTLVQYCILKGNCHEKSVSEKNIGGCIGP